MDSITVELVVTATLMEVDQIWMQGDLEIRFNGERPYGDSDRVDAVALLESMERDGDYFIFSCCCGVPSCSQWKKGILVSKANELTTWTDLNTGKVWNFDSKNLIADLDAVREVVKIYKSFFGKKGIKYVGVGYDW